MTSMNRGSVSVASQMGRAGQAVFSPITRPPPNTRSDSTNSNFSTAATPSLETVEGSFSPRNSIVSAALQAPAGNVNSARHAERFNDVEDSKTSINKFSSTINSSNSSNSNSRKSSFRKGHQTSELGTQRPISPRPSSSGSRRGSRRNSPRGNQPQPQRPPQMSYSNSEEHSIGIGVAAAERSKGYQQESGKDDLQSELEILRMQNQMLTRRIQKAQQESMEELEKERRQRLLAVQRLEHQNVALNQQLVEANETAQLQLRREKGEFVAAMRDMQQEKETLLDRVRRTEELAERESQLIKMQRAELEQQLYSLRQERNLLAQRIEDNGAQLAVQQSEAAFVSESVVGAIAFTDLEGERDSLKLLLQQLKEREQALSGALRNTESAAQQNMQHLAAQLAAEKERMELRVATMSEQQQALAQQLQQKEALMKSAMEETTRRLEAERLEAAEKLAAMQRAHEQLEAQMKAQQQQQQLLEQHQNKSGGPTEKKKDEVSIVKPLLSGGETASPVAATTGAAAVSAVESTVISEDPKVREMDVEMQRLRAELKRKDTESKAREKLLAEHSRREKEELKRAVQRMREEMLAEKKLKIDKSESSEDVQSAGRPLLCPAAAAASATTATLHSRDNVTPSGRKSAVGVNGNNGSQIVLASKMSLFELLGESNVQTNGAADYSILKNSSNTTLAGYHNQQQQQQQYRAPASDRNSLRIIGNSEVPHFTSSVAKTSSYYKIHLTRRSIADCFHLLDKPISEEGNAAVDSDNAATAAEKTIMDISDSSSDSDGDDSTNKRAKSKARISNAASAAVSGAGADHESPTKDISGAHFVSEDMVAGLPPAHSAAALGQVDRLKSFSGTTDDAAVVAPGLQKARPDLLRSLDAAERQPLFYAAAYGHANAVAYLLQVLLPSILVLADESSNRREAGRSCDQLHHYSYEAQHMHWMAGDMHGDTPLHAAATSGNSTCCELLLSAAVCVLTGRLWSPRSFLPLSDIPTGKSPSSNRIETNEYAKFVQAVAHTYSRSAGSIAGAYSPSSLAAVADPRNQMQMTPAHLASSSEVLETLYSYNAHLTAVDCNNRSPLFISCAMNREDCAEFLVSCLDYESAESLIASDSTSGGSDTSLAHLMQQDRRGDTPLHAASCNGAVECLLLLLQYGIDPRPTNLQGLKAIDLAVRNRQQKCKEILAEYHLHYCTSSEFDSVLFLATLEGHRKAKEEFDSGSYKIIQSSASKSAHASRSQSASRSPLQLTPRSRSPLAGRSPRASEFRSHHNNSNNNRIGDGLLGQHHTATTGAVVGVSNGAGTAGKAKDALDESSRALTRAAQSMFSLRSSRSMRLQRYGNWISYHDAQTQTVFWYNHATCEGTWDQPEEVGQMQRQNQQEPTAMQNYFDKTLKSRMSMRMRKFGDWIEYVTEKGSNFYYNQRDGSFQWESPFSADSQQSQHLSGVHTGGLNGSGSSGNGSCSPYGISANNNELRKRPEHKAQLASSNISTQAGTVTAIAATADTMVADVEWSPAIQQQQYAGDWQPYLDPDSGSLFWYNHKTCVSQWECPEEVEMHSPIHQRLEQQHNQQQQQHYADNLFDDGSLAAMDDHSVFAIHDHENDLGI